MYERSRVVLQGFGRAIARWNRLGLKTIDSCEILDSRALAVHENVFFYYIRQFRTGVFRLALLI